MLMNQVNTIILSEGNYTKLYKIANMDFLKNDFNMVCWKRGRWPGDLNIPHSKYVIIQEKLRSMSLLDTHLKTNMLK